MSQDLSQDPIFFDEPSQPQQTKAIQPIPQEGVTLTKDEVSWCLRILELLHNKDMPYMAVSDIAYHVEHVLNPKAFELCKRNHNEPMF